MILFYKKYYYTLFIHILFSEFPGEKLGCGYTQEDFGSCQSRFVISLISELSPR